MDDMWRIGGYALVDRNDNPRCFFCSEILLARIRGAHQHVKRSGVLGDGSGMGTRRCELLGAAAKGC